MEAGLRVRMATDRQNTRVRFFRLFLVLAFFIAHVAAQDAGKTVRHHLDQQDSAATNLREAESAIEKQDYTGAEALLSKYLENHPDDYTGWYDLGFVKHALGK